MDFATCRRWSYGGQAGKGGKMGILSKIFSATAGTAVKDTLGAVGTLAKDLRAAITGDISPEKQAELLAKAQEIEALSQQGQVQINLEEAKSTSLWVAGWRPFIGWICGTSIGCYFIPQYLGATIIWAFACWQAKAMVAFPIEEPKGLIELVLTLLGLGALRTYEKTQNAEGNR